MRVVRRADDHGIQSWMFDQLAKIIVGLCSGKFFNSRAQKILINVADPPALRHLRSTRYDLTVCDWKMPGLSGQQVYEQLHASDPKAAEGLIFMTVDVVNEKTQQFLNEHGNICLEKPFSLDAFRSAVSKALAA